MITTPNAPVIGADSFSGIRVPGALNVGKAVKDSSLSKPAVNALAHDEAGKIGLTAPLLVWTKAKRGGAMINVTR